MKYTDAKQDIIMIKKKGYISGWVITEKWNIVIKILLFRFVCIMSVWGKQLIYVNTSVYRWNRWKALKKGKYIDTNNYLNQLIHYTHVFFK